MVVCSRLRIIIEKISFILQKPDVENDVRHPWQTHLAALVEENGRYYPHHRTDR